MSWKVFHLLFRFSKSKGYVCCVIEHFWWFHSNCVTLYFVSVTLFLLVHFDIAMIIIIYFLTMFIYLNGHATMHVLTYHLKHALWRGHLRKRKLSENKQYQTNNSEWSTREPDKPICLRSLTVDWTLHELCYQMVIFLWFMQNIDMRY